MHFSVAVATLVVLRAVAASALSSGDDGLSASINSGVDPAAGKSIGKRMMRLEKSMAVVISSNSASQFENSMTTPGGKLASEEEEDAHSIEKCPIPEEMHSLSNYPSLHEGPYTHSPSMLRDKYKVNITDDDGKTFTELFGPTSPIVFFAVRGSRLFQRGGNIGPVASVFQNFAQMLGHATQGPDMLSVGADFCYDATDNDAFALDRLRDAELYCASPITWMPAAYPVIAVPNYYYEQSLVHTSSGPLTVIPWEQKVSKIFWRGGLTGTLDMYTGGSADPFFNLPRVVSYKLAQEHPDVFDFGFTGFDEQLTDRYMGGRRTKEQAEFLGGLQIQQSVNFSVELPRFKYLLNIDGIVVAWRLRDLLRSGSVVFHFVGKSAEFFFRDLTPWKHYVPVHDIQEVPTLYAKLEADPELAQSIAAAGKDFADTRLTVAGQDCYLSRFLEFVSNRTAYKLADPAGLREMGFFEVDV